MSKSIWFFTRRVPPEHSGAGKRCINQAKWFNEYGYDVSVITYTKNPFKVEGINFLQMEGLSSFGFHSKIFNFFRLYKSLDSLLAKKKKPDIIHVYSDGVDSYVLHLLKKKYTFKVVSEIVISIPDNIIVKWLHPFSFLRKIGLMKSDCVIANSLGVKRSLEKHGITREILVIQNAVDTEIFSPIQKNKKELRNELNLPMQSLLLLMVGRVSFRKGHDIALKVLIEILKFIDAHLVLVGPYKSKYAKALNAKLSNRELDIYKSDKVIKVGYTDNVVDYYRACDILIFPSRQEGMPNVILEAMASKIPVVSSKLVGITDTIIINRKNGYLVSTEDIDSYVGGIKYLMSEKNKKKEIVENGLKTVKEKFSEEKIRNQYMSLYTQITVNT